jgi:hypothetical protein
MTTIDIDTLTEGENPVRDAGGASVPTLVVRISHTASGARTWTIGATAPLTPGGQGELLARLLAVDDAMTALNEGQSAGQLVSAGDGDPTLTEQLRRSLIVSALRQATIWHPEDGEDKPQGWLRSADIVAAVGGSRARIVADLQALVRAGVIEYRAGGGRSRPSTYRLAPLGGAPNLKVIAE